MLQKFGLMCELVHTGKKFIQTGFTQMLVTMKVMVGLLPFPRQQFERDHPMRVGTLNGPAASMLGPGCPAIG
jgi:hypothetical protein